jgi:hypothetical protein
MRIVYCRAMHRVAGVAALVLFSVTTEARAAGVTVQFPYEDNERLYPYQHDGGLAYVASRPASGKVPLVVFLHGNNTQAQVHMWTAGIQDLRPLASQLAGEVGSFVLASPSQTKDALNAATLWNDLDIDDFATKAADAVAGSAEIDRDRVYVIAHSGAGCNPMGGITRAAHARVRAVMALDTCLDEETGKSFAPLTRLWVVWQSKTWPRDIAAFERGLGYASVGVRIDELEGESIGAHDAIVPTGFARAIRTWL